MNFTMATKAWTSQTHQSSRLISWIETRPCFPGKKQENE